MIVKIVCTCGATGEVDPDKLTGQLSSQLGYPIFGCGNCGKVFIVPDEPRTITFFKGQPKEQ